MIRTRLTLWNTLFFSLTLILLGTMLFYTTRSGLYRAVDDDLSRRATFLETRWSHRPTDRQRQNDRDRDRDQPPRPPDFLSAAKAVDPIQAKRLEFNAALVMPRVFPNEQVREGRTHDVPFDTGTLHLSQGGQRVFTTMVVMGHSVRILSLPLRAADGTVNAVAQFASNLEDVDDVVLRMRNIMLIMFPLALIATYALGVQLTNRALKPVRDITQAAGRIEAASLGERLPVDGKDEFALLSSQFNEMLERIETSYSSLEAAYEAQRRFVGDASHELKTPLTTIKGRVGLALMKEQTGERYQEHLQSIGRSADSMVAIIQDLLLLANSDEKKLALNFEDVPFADLANEAIHALPHANERVRVTAPPNAIVHVDPKLFRQVLVNLLSNAMRHSEEEKMVELTTDGKTISVKDYGEGVDAQHLPHLFDRFYRVDESRFRGTGGSGLGLAIVKSIVEAHGGTVKVESAVGVGTTVTVTLPQSM